MKQAKILLVLIVLFHTLTSESCDDTQQGTPVSSSGVQKTTAKVQTDLNGKTLEQNNILERYKRDNQPGSIKHLYIISSYSGQVLIYSTVKGKVTSSGKRLTPNTVAADDGEHVGLGHSGFPIDIGGRNVYTGEVLQDDGTYGSSTDYLYWFDSKGVYHQQYVTGGMILHISDQPIAVKGVIINMEASK